MRQLTVTTDCAGDVLVSEELLESATIETAVGHLRLGGGQC